VAEEEHGNRAADEEGNEMPLIGKVKLTTVVCVGGVSEMGR